MENIFIFGSQGHSKVVIDIVEREGKYNIIGLVDDYRSLDEKTFGHDIVGRVDQILELKNKYHVKTGIIAVGDNYARKFLAEKIKSLDPSFEFCSSIHPSAQIGRDVIIGKGCVVAAAAVINPGVVIEEHCIINTNSSLDHDSHLGSYSSLAPGVVTGGNVSIGTNSALCIGACVSHGIKVGNNVVIGARALVVTDITDNVVAYGTPCKVIRSRNSNDSYL